MSTPYVNIGLHRAGGESIILSSVHDSSNPLVLIEGAQGLGMAPASYASAARLVGHGSLKRGGRLDEREIFLPFLLDAGNSGLFNIWLDRISSILSPLNSGELTLRVSVPGRAGWREIPVDYLSGLEDTGEMYRGEWGTIGLRFKAFGALWRGTPQVIRRSVNPATKPFLSETEPFFPVVLSDATVDDEITLDVQGNAPTWPTWVVTPPGRDLTIRNLTTGQTFQLVDLITETVTVDMRRGRVTSATYPNGELLDNVPPDKGAMFPLQPGSNRVGFSVVEASEASELILSYEPQFLRGH